MIRIEVSGETINDVVRDLRALADVLQGNPMQAPTTPRKTRRQPRLASSVASSSPRPRDAPVTTATSSARSSSG